jgi:hypothetical protein
MRGDAVGALIAGADREIGRFLGENIEGKKGGEERGRISLRT